MSATPPHRLRLPDAVLAATVALVALDASVILRAATTTPGLPLYLTYVAGHHLFLAVLGLAAVALFARIPARRARPLAAAVVTYPLFFLLLGEDLQRFGLGMHLLITLAFAAGPLVLGVAALWRPTPRLLRLALVLAALALVLADHNLLPENYPGFHVTCALLAPLAGGVALAGLPVPFGLATPRWLRRLRDLGVLALACWSVVVPPSNDVAVRLATADTAALYRFVSPLYREDPIQYADYGLGNEFFRVRTDAPPIPAGAPLQPREHLVVLLLSIDALRHDVAAGKRGGRLRSLDELRTDGIVFANAYAPATSTTGTISGLFTGRYLSQIRWERAEIQGKLDFVPAEVDSLRFPGLLTAAGVATYLVPTHWRVAQSGRMASGFAEEYSPDVTGYRDATEALPALLEWLGRPHAGPVFAFCHLVDAHAPYDRGGKHGEPFDRYLRELEHVDEQLTKFLGALRRTPMWRRTIVIVTADHGEAFGEHGLTKHGGWAYEELLHVPLLMRVPGERPRHIPEVVSLIDLGPTILDLFGVDTPGSVMGQTLVPLLRGEPADFSRPVGFRTTNGQLGVVFPDRVKALYVPSARRMEVYDLASDPAETTNLADQPWAQERVAMARAFFHVHDYKLPD